MQRQTARSETFSDFNRPDIDVVAPQLNHESDVNSRVASRFYSRDECHRQMPSAALLTSH